MELILGCGSRKTKDIITRNTPDYECPVRLDNNPDHRPDVLWDLNQHPLPFEDNKFDEIHAYEVLEHLSKQGDYGFFFKEFEEYHRVLKPNGLFVASAPKWNSMWAWGDPSHTRVITPGTLAFLSQAQYTLQVGKTAMSDFRGVYKADFEVLMQKEAGEQFYFVLRAIK